uniref:Uncharacterized protein n=1 Tax=Glossina pallidipes TaxID=7398 RepID=A0A1A9ZVA0_GLOPL
MSGAHLRRGLMNAASNFRSTPIKHVMRAIKRCSSSLAEAAAKREAAAPVALSTLRPVARESIVLERSKRPPPPPLPDKTPPRPWSNDGSLKPLCEGSGDGGTMCDKFNVFSGCSGNRGNT